MININIMSIALDLMHVEVFHYQILSSFGKTVY